MALALYRKYRPRLLSELMGQEEVVEILRNAAKSDKIAHAYLFYGPRGTGKTTTARLVAKLANCETRAKDPKFKSRGEPCNKCRACLEIDAGRALDVVEIDAASNRGIDEIRNLKEGIRLAPTSSLYKVYIIDEAHQLTKEASNALLKTLEEPPAHAIFILATTEFDKLPPTIVSRTQRFRFNRLPVILIVKELKKIAEAEKFKIDEPALELIASAAEGSFRDAESLLDQVMSLGESVKAADVIKILGKVDFQKTSDLAGRLIEGDLEKSIDYLEKLNEEGYNIVQLAKDLINYFRRLLALQADSGLEKAYANEFTEEELKTIKAQSQTIVFEKHVALVKSLIEAYSQMRYSPFPVTPLELAIIENLYKPAGKA
ncbi:MAG TPA: DNA polymerase III subunit gamma/tau [Candidatus Tyrphobacter sp.]|nr:DNA polymerase III subunit gamma/tau [Candidatus Tyrphobacter sp.]